MKKFLMPLLAVLSLPTAANAEYYLFFGTYTAEKSNQVSKYGSSQLHSAIFNSLETCESAGQKLTSGIYMPIKYFDGSYACVKK